MIVILLGLLQLSSANPAPYVVRVDESISKNSSKSISSAILFSAILPGTGEYYLGDRNRMRLFIASDAFFWAAVWISWTSGEKYLKNARGYAARYAGSEYKGLDPDFLDLMGRYRSRSGVAGNNSSPDNEDDYNQYLLRQNKAIDWEYPDNSSYQWDWGSSDNPQNSQRIDHYNDIITNYRTSKVMFQVAVGALLLNRVLSVIDVIQLYRSTGVTGFTYDFDPLITPTSTGGNFRIGF
jgi:hypothetical protein